MAWKLMDLQNFALYFDHELLGDLEGQSLTVSYLMLQVPQNCMSKIFIISCYNIRGLKKSTSLM